MPQLTLYTTLGCHLCEALEGELARLGRSDIALWRVEIADDEALLERYGTRIPVLTDGQGDELDRGFEAERLAAWLDGRGLLAPSASEAPAAASPQKSLEARQVRGRRFLG